MNLSVIIPTRDRAGLLERCLDSLLHQSLGPEQFEVIVVDNGSTDHTRSVCERLRQRLPTLRYVSAPAPGLHTGRHAGLRSARGEILVYADDDIRAAPTWLEGVREGFSDPGVALVGGKVLPDLEAPAPGWFEGLKRSVPPGWYVGAYSLVDLGDAVRDVPPRLVVGCNFSIRAAVLRDVGGFHPDGMPADLLRYRGDGETAVSDAIEARGLRARYHPSASVFHRVSRARMTAEYLAGRAYRQGISDSYSRIRRGGGVSRVQRLASGRRWLAAEARRLLEGRQPAPSRVPDTRAAYWRGFCYHQREVARDRGLLEWVLRPTYLED